MQRLAFKKYIVTCPEYQQNGTKQPILCWCAVKQLYSLIRPKYQDKFIRDNVVLMHCCYYFPLLSLSPCSFNSANKLQTVHHYWSGPAHSGS